MAAAVVIAAIQSSKMMCASRQNGLRSWQNGVRDQAK
jgi:hypothetical protein